MSNRRAVRSAAAILPALAAALLVQACSASPGILSHPPGPAAHRPPAPTLYIYGSDYDYGYGSDVGSAANHGNVVTPVNTATNTPGKPIHVGVGGTGPGGMIVITPDGKTAYVTTASGTITPISTATGMPGKPINFRGRNEGNRPDFIVITPNGKTAYVTAWPYRSGDGITPVNTVTNTPRKPIRILGAAIGGIAVIPDGKTAYVTSGSGVTPVSTATGRPGKPISIGGEWALRMVVTPDGKTAYVTTINRTQCNENYRCPYMVTPISTATGTSGKSIHVGFSSAYFNSSGEIAITPDGKTAYVVSQNGCRIFDPCTYTVTPISTATNTPSKPIHVGGFGPYWFGGEIVITPDGKTAYVNTGSGVTPISTATGMPGKPIHVPAGAIGGIAITP